MAVELPEPLQWVLLLLAGTRWPEGEEDLMRDMARRWRASAETLDEAGRAADSAVRRALDGQQGASAEGLEKNWNMLVLPVDGSKPGFFPGMVKACNAMADSLEAMANSTETAKISIVAQLGILAFEIATAEAAAPVTAGASLTAIAPAIAVSKATVQQILKKLAKEIIEYALKEAFQEVAINLLAQSIQLAAGNRKELDGKELGMSAAGGAIGGAAGGMIGKGLGAAGNKLIGKHMDGLPAQMVEGALTDVGADVVTQLALTGEVDASGLGGSALSGAGSPAIMRGASALKGKFNSSDIPDASDYTGGGTDTPGNSGSGNGSSDNGSSGSGTPGSNSSGSGTPGSNSSGSGSSGSNSSGSGSSGSNSSGSGASSNGSSSNGSSGNGTSDNNSSSPSNSSGSNGSTPSNGSGDQSNLSDIGSDGHHIRQNYSEGSNPDVGNTSGDQSNLSDIGSDGHHVRQNYSEGSQPDTSVRSDESPRPRGFEQDSANTPGRNESDAPRTFSTTRSNDGDTTPTFERSYEGPTGSRSADSTPSHNVLTPYEAPAAPRQSDAPPRSTDAPPTPLQSNTPDPQSRPEVPHQQRESPAPDPQRGPEPQQSGSPAPQRSTPSSDSDTQSTPHEGTRLASGPTMMRTAPANPTGGFSDSHTPTIPVPDPGVTPTAPTTVPPSATPPTTGPSRPGTPTVPPQRRTPDQATTSAPGNAGPVVGGGLTHGLAPTTGDAPQQNEVSDSGPSTPRPVITGPSASETQPQRPMAPLNPTDVYYHGGATSKTSAYQAGNLPGSHLVTSGRRDWFAFYAATSPADAASYMLNDPAQTLKNLQDARAELELQLNAPGTSASHGTPEHAAEQQRLTALRDDIDRRIELAREEVRNYDASAPPQAGDFELLTVEPKPGSEKYTVVKISEATWDDESGDKEARIWEEINARRQSEGLPPLRPGSPLMDTLGNYGIALLGPSSDTPPGEAPRYELVVPFSLVPGLELNPNQQQPEFNKGKYEHLWNKQQLDDMDAYRQAVKAGRRDEYLAEVEQRRQAEEQNQRELEEQRRHEEEQQRQAEERRLAEERSRREAEQNRLDNAAPTPTQQESSSSDAPQTSRPTVDSGDLWDGDYEMTFSDSESGSGADPAADSDSDSDSDAEPESPPDPSTDPWAGDYSMSLSDSESDNESIPSPNVSLGPVPQAPSTPGGFQSGGEGSTEINQAASASPSSTADSASGAPTVRSAPTDTLPPAAGAQPVITAPVASPTNGSTTVADVSVQVGSESSSEQDAERWSRSEFQPHESGVQRLDHKAVFYHGGATVKTEALQNGDFPGSHIKKSAERQWFGFYGASSPNDSSGYMDWQIKDDITGLQDAKAELDEKLADLRKQNSSAEDIKATQDNIDDLTKQIELRQEILDSGRYGMKKKDGEYELLKVQLRPGQPGFDIVTIDKTTWDMGSPQREAAVWNKVGELLKKGDAWPAHDPSTPLLEKLGGENVALLGPSGQDGKGAARYELVIPYELMGRMSLTPNPQQPDLLSGSTFELNDGQLQAMDQYRQDVKKDTAEGYEQRLAHETEQRRLAKQQAEAAAKAKVDADAAAALAEAEADAAAERARAEAAAEADADGAASEAEADAEKDDEQARQVALATNEGSVDDLFGDMDWGSDEEPTGADLRELSVDGKGPSDDAGGPVLSDPGTGDDSYRPATGGRPQGSPGGLLDPSDLDSSRIVNAVPHGADGRPQVHPDPTKGNWVGAINGDGPRTPGRNNNCVDVALATVDTYSGHPTAAASRTPDLDTEGRQSGTGERNGRDRIESALGAKFSYLGDGPAAFGRLEGTLRQNGHGSQAVIITADKDGRSHAWNAVNHNGKITYIDSQTGRRADQPLHNGEGGVFAIPLDPDRKPGTMTPDTTDRPSEDPGQSNDADSDGEIDDDAGDTHDPNAPEGPLTTEDLLAADPGTFFKENLVFANADAGLALRHEGVLTQSERADLQKLIDEQTNHWFTLVPDPKRSTDGRPAYVLTPALEKYAEANGEIRTLIGSRPMPPARPDSDYLQSGYVPFKYGAPSKVTGSDGVQRIDLGKIGHADIPLSGDGVSGPSKLVVTPTMNGCALAVTPSTRPGHFTAWHYQSPNGNVANERAALFRRDQRPTDWFGWEEYESADTADTDKTKTFEVTNTLWQDGDGGWHIVSQENRETKSEEQVSTVRTRPLKLTPGTEDDQAAQVAQIYAGLAQKELVEFDRAATKLLAKPYWTPAGRQEVEEQLGQLRRQMETQRDALRAMAGLDSTAPFTGTNPVAMPPRQPEGPQQQTQGNQRVPATFADLQNLAAQAKRTRTEVVEDTKAVLLAQAVAGPGGQDPRQAGERLGTVNGELDWFTPEDRWLDQMAAEVTAHPAAHDAAQDYRPATAYRPTGSDGLAQPTDADQALIDGAVPRVNGAPEVHPSPDAAGDWIAAINGVDPNAPGRGNNCVDVALSTVDTYLGHPTAAAPRTPPSSLGEVDGRDRIENSLGARFADLGDGAEAFGRLEETLLTSGHGSQAVIITTDEQGRAHAWNAVNHNDTITYIDAQSGRRDNGPLHDGDKGVFAIVLRPDRGVVDVVPDPEHGTGRRPDARPAADSSENDRPAGTGKKGPPPPPKPLHLQSASGAAPVAAPVADPVVDQATPSTEGTGESMNQEQIRTAIKDAQNVPQLMTALNQPATAGLDAWQTMDLLTGSVNPGFAMTEHIKPVPVPRPVHLRQARERLDMTWTIRHYTAAGTADQAPPFEQIASTYENAAAGRVSANTNLADWQKLGNTKFTFYVIAVNGEVAGRTFLGNSKWYAEWPLESLDDAWVSRDLLDITRPGVDPGQAIQSNFPIVRGNGGDLRNYLACNSTGSDPAAVAADLDRLFGGNHELKFPGGLPMAEGSGWKSNPQQR